MTSFLDWYLALHKPSWTPAPETIRTIWMILYPVIFLSFGYVFLQFGRRKISGWVALPFILNLLANLLFMPIQSGLRDLWLASVDILVVWATLLWAIVAIWPHVRWVALVQIPYLLWVSIATVLQLSITWMNDRYGAWTS
jgi:tryptophan-rich sensory protein